MSTRRAKSGIIIWVAVLSVLDIALVLREAPLLALYAASFYVSVTVVFLFGLRVSDRGMEGWSGVMFLCGGSVLLGLTTAIAFYALDPVALAVGMPAGAAAIPLGALDAGRAILTRRHLRLDARLNLQLLPPVVPSRVAPQAARRRRLG